jgi:hypothetical protein
MRHATGEALDAKLRTALVLLSIAAAFFIGIIVRYWLT